MKLLRFHYEMTYSYDLPIREHYFSLKCIPQSDCRQKIQTLDVRVTPYQYLSRERDAFSNEMLIGNCLNEHKNFDVLVQGVAQTGMEEYTGNDDSQNIIFRNQSPYTLPGECIREFYRQNELPGDVSDYERALHLMRKLHQTFRYEKDVTDIYTTAEEALQKGSGVCQDYTHILLSLLRIAGIPCRYVVGMMVGEGLSHAWTEVFSQGRWYGLDATNNLLVSEDYVKISHGRDYGDCIINKGIYVGNAVEHQKISVVVEAE